ncbi:type I restriction enzyme HsdR N-terminal domain-containing protein [Aquimarina aquimarini]|uniref:type I restriction enzyme HsdR N-terminal domain-containing protein n=1 Tax=Aquimarina aquimarini TaxID=1191734 RepID=UPI000D555E7B|nr:type I restriction enzyme HsdR N-terminal domain-containing protein [Aquimarina aquimarini]
MQKLNFPEYRFRFKNSENKVSIFDRIRKKFIILTPEEWVRQHTVHFLIDEKKYPESLINVEKLIKFNDLNKRYDIIIFNPDGSIFLIVECKSTRIKITQEVFDQIARYNLALNAEYLMITNGIDHYYCQMNYTEKKYTFLKDIPNHK